MSFESVKAALFVDFDNVFTGLSKIDYEIARRFAKDPWRWLQWLEKGSPQTEKKMFHKQRSILIRRCYLNPRAYNTYRTFFVRSAFRVIDCPPLTQQGKTSTDIHMVMDILDVLNGFPHIKEFIIFSADADFTPVLLRLRAYDRQTAVLAIGPAASGYMAACDELFSEESFIEYGLGITHAQWGPLPESVVMETTDEVLEQMAIRVFEEAEAKGELVGSELPPLFKAFEDFRNSNSWLGFGTLKHLVDELVRRRPDLLVVVDGDPWHVMSLRHYRGQREVRVPKNLSPQEQALQQKIILYIQRRVQTSKEPIVMAKMAEEIREHFEEEWKEQKPWLGYASFKDFLINLDLKEVLINTEVPPGYLYDPQKHGPLQIEDSDRQRFQRFPEPLAHFVRQIWQLTSVPPLTTQQYQKLFKILSEEVRKNPYHFTTTSKAVRDRCKQLEQPISRANISFVMRGIAYTGHQLGEHPEEDTPERLARAFRDNVRNLLEDAQFHFDAEDECKLNAWILGSPMMNHTQGDAD